MYFVAAKSQHPDTIVNDISFDFYGKRFATGSVDHKIRIYDLSDDDHESDSWHCVEISDAHSGPVWRLSWAHPEFGSLIASCSEDKTVCIWEEQIAVTRSRTGERWSRKCQMADSKKEVKDVKFAPQHLGLLLAAASEDGKIRIYEASDPFNLTSWSMKVF